MAYDDDYLKKLLQYPRESLSVELKPWLEPSSKEGCAVIAKTCLGLYNNNGGVLVIGFNNDCTPDKKENVPYDIKKSFHQDVVQAIVAKYSSKPFEVNVKFIERDGQEYPVLCVDSGVRVPVATKSGLNSDDNPTKPLIAPHQVYVRTLSANNTPSTSQAKCDDWDRLVDLCFENREADIGKFIRRHLSSVDSGKIKQLVDAIAIGTRDTPEIVDDLKERCDDAYLRFLKATNTVNRQLLEVGTWEVGFKIIGDLPHYYLNKQFIDKVLSTNPSYTGWPIWVDSRQFSDSTNRPIVVEGAWQCFIPPRSTGDMFSFDDLDFWRIEPSGFFYALRGLEDDLSTSKQNPKNNTLDFGLMIYRISEALAVASAFAKALVSSTDNTVLKFFFRWHRLNGRKLYPWAEPHRFWRLPGGTAHQDDFAYTIEIPLESAISSLHQHTANILNRLFELFDGTNMDAGIYEELTNKLLSKGK